MVRPQESWESPVSIRGPCSKYYYVLLGFMSIYILSLTYFTNDSVCYMQGIFEFPSWNDQGLVATKFRHWFNHVASKRWSDHKNRSLKGTGGRLASPPLIFRLNNATPGFGPNSSSNLRRLRRRQRAA